MSRLSATYQEITAELIKLLRSGQPLPWRSLFKKADRNTGSPLSILKATPSGNVVTKNDYSGVNFLFLAMAAHRKGFSSRWWGTFKQWQSIGASVKKGEKGTGIVFFDHRTVTNPTTGKKKEEPFHKWHTVFNLEQVEGKHLDRYRAGAPEAKLTQSDLDERFNQADEMIEATGAKIVYMPRSQRAFYLSSSDLIQMPEKERCRSEAFYSVILHELAHWTGHKSRLNRPGIGCSKHSPEYAFEELVAEIASAFTAARLGIPTIPLEETAAYLEYWLERMKEDPHFIIDAAKAASRASGYLLKIAPPERKKTSAQKTTPAQTKTRQHEFVQ